MDLLLHFQGPDLLEAEEHPSQSVPFPVIVLQNALTKLLALPVEVSYTLPESLKAMGSQFTYERRDRYHYPLGHGLRSEAVHALWHQGATNELVRLQQEGRKYLYALRALLWDLRGKLKDQLFAWPDKFLLPAREAFADPLISRLAFFTRYESLVQCLALRDEREVPPAVQEQLGISIGLVACADGSFDVVGEPAIELDESTMPSWLFVPDTADGRRAQLSFRDHAYRNKPYGKVQPGGGLAGVDAVEEDEFGRPVRVRLLLSKDAPSPLVGGRYRLLRRFMDFNSDRVIEYLRRVDEAGGGFFAAIVRDPQSAAKVVPLPSKVEESAVAEEPKLKLMKSQMDAYREIRRRRLVAVWGPPGTGKTHSIAVIILGLLRAYEATKRPFRVLVTAFTHAAIENVLKKVVELRSKLACDAMVAKAKGWMGAGAGVDAVVPEETLVSWLAANERCVVGATVYDCLKAGKKEALPGFDLVVVDEASQVRVAEAAIPASLVAPKGRLVLAGDDLQLPPIVQGKYPDVEDGQPILHRSIFEAVRSRVPHGGPVVRMLMENRRMNDVLTSFAAALLYGPDYKCFDKSISSRRLALLKSRNRSPFVKACLDPDYPLVVVVLEGVQAAASNPVEASLVADLVTALRDELADQAVRPSPQTRSSSNAVCSLSVPIAPRIGKSEDNSETGVLGVRNPLSIRSTRCRAKRPTPS
ncbi:MAG: AAA domain-containing protein [Gemmataceae bacterium]